MFFKYLLSVESPPPKRERSGGTDVDTRVEPAGVYP
jgi:hypothetical protein